MCVLVGVATYGADKRLDPLIEATAEQTAYRSQVEDCIRAVKARAAEDSTLVDTVRDQYTKAADSVNEYYTAALDAVENRQGRADVADYGVRASTAVLALLKTLDAHRLGDRSLIAVVPPLLHIAVALFDLPKKGGHTATRLDAVAKSLGWAPWEAIR
jgi:hypothetical protein